MKKYSPHREALLISLKNRQDHPTADTLYFELKQKFPSISLATVYRNLVDLSNEGEIKRLQMGNRSDCFDGNTDEHIHFVCNKCNKICDVALSSEYKNKITDVSLPKLNRIGAEIQNYDITLKGICGECNI